MKSPSRVRLFTTPWTAAYQAPPSTGFSRQKSTGVGCHCLLWWMVEVTSKFSHFQKGSCPLPPNQPRYGHILRIPWPWTLMVASCCPRKGTKNYRAKHETRCPAQSSQRHLHQFLISENWAVSWHWVSEWSHSVVSNSLWPHGLQPTRLFCPWDFPGRNTGVGCHFLPQEIFPIQGLNLVSLIVSRCFTIWATTLQVC